MSTQETTPTDENANAKSATSHTPTPWHIRGRDIDAANGSTVATIEHAPHMAAPLDERVANAAFIVRAVNAHHPLVAALSRVMDRLDDGDLDEATTLGLDAWIMESRAALALARGEA